MANNLRNSFNKTSLDISDVRPAGGPTRTNASNVLPRGTRAKENPGSLTKGGQPLKLKDGSAYIYDGEKWDVRQKEESINILVDKAFNMIVSYYNRRKKLYREKNKIITKQKINCQ